MQNSLLRAVECLLSLGRAAASSLKWATASKQCLAANLNLSSSALDAEFESGCSQNHRQVQVQRVGPAHGDDTQACMHAGAYY